MKTWTNPELEELEVELTAGGVIPFFFEQIGSNDYPIFNGPSNNNPTPDTDPNPGEGEGEGEGDGSENEGELEEGTPS